MHTEQQSIYCLGFDTSDQNLIRALLLAAPDYNFDLVFLENVAELAGEAPVELQTNPPKNLVILASQTDLQNWAEVEHSFSDLSHVLSVAVLALTMNDDFAVTGSRVGNPYVEVIGWPAGSDGWRKISVRLKELLTGVK